MTDTILELFPGFGIQRDLKDLYLHQGLRDELASHGAFIYANFVTSLDGRIAVPHPQGGPTVPDSLVNPRDWRLFQELAVQSDIMLSSGRYLRDYEAGRAQEILQIYDDPALADLADWRLRHGLDRHPAIAIISASLDFPIPDALIEGGRRVVVITTEESPGDRRQALAKRGLDLIIAGEIRVNGAVAVEELGKLGYRLIYSAAGPRVCHMLLESKVLHRLYLTVAARILGGAPFASIMEGPLLAEPADLTLKQLYLDPQAPGPGGQFFAVYEAT